MIISQIQTILFIMKEACKNHHNVHSITEILFYQALVNNIKSAIIEVKENSKGKNNHFCKQKLCK